MYVLIRENGDGDDGIFFGVDVWTGVGYDVWYDVFALPYWVRYQLG